MQQRQEERSVGLTKSFSAALLFVISLPATMKDTPIPFSERMKLYGLYRRIKHGLTKKPSSFLYPTILKAKLDMANSFNHLTVDQAMKEFVAIVEKYLVHFPPSKVKDSLSFVLKGHQIQIYLPNPPDNALAVIWLCLVGNIPFQLQPSNATPSTYTAITSNSSPLLPHHYYHHAPLVLDPRGSTLLQGITTIVRYLASNFLTLEDFYPLSSHSEAFFKVAGVPTDKRIKIDQYLDWHNLDFQFLLDSLQNSNVKDRDETFRNRLTNCLTMINDVFLRDSLTVGGTVNPSIADIVCMASLVGLEKRGMGSLLKPFRKLVSYMDCIVRRVRSFEEANSLLDNLLQQTHPNRSFTTEVASL